MSSSPVIINRTIRGLDIVSVLCVSRKEDLVIMVVVSN